jgi:hypothetical protein
MEQPQAIWCCFSPSADKRRISGVWRMDNACSDKFNRKRLVNHSEILAISRSELRRFFDHHRLGTFDRAHLGTMSFISSEWQVFMSRQVFRTWSA